MNPQERKQATILSSAIVVVLAGGAVWMRSIMGGSSSSPAPSVPVSNPPPNLVADNRPASTAVKTESPIVISPPSTTTAAKPTGDPFRKVLTDPANTNPPGVTLEEARAKADENRRNQLAKINARNDYPPIQGQFPLPEASSSSSVKPFSPTEAMNASFKLEGVVSNHNGPMAVISYAGTTLYLKPGDQFGDGIRVASIHRLYATFSRDKKVFRADVGGGLQ